VEAPEDKKRLVRRLIGEGRDLAAGQRVSNNPGSLFQVLYRAVLSRSDPRRAAQTALALSQQGWDIPSEMARSPQEKRFRVIRDASHRRDARQLAAVLGDLASMIVRRYRGDLRRLRSAARQDPGAERKLLKELPGVDDAAVDLFFRDVQGVWNEIAPFADRPALTAARRLGLGRSVTELSELAGSRRSERLPWLVGALARVDQEKRYAEFGAPTA
jgi:hypothetical protein